MNTKFRFLIVDTFDGVAKGTNNEQLARDISDSEDHFVIDTKTQSWVVGGEEEEIEEWTSEPLED